MFTSRMRQAAINDYWVNNNYDQLGIKYFSSGGRIGLDNDFGFDTLNYASQVSATYDSGTDQTFIDINTANFTKDDIVVIDGHFELGQLQLDSNQYLTMYLHEPGKMFDGVVTIDGNRLVINANNLPDNWNGKGLLVNASSNEVFYEGDPLSIGGSTVPAFSALFPDGTSMSWTP